MRYILDDLGYIEEVSFGAEIICNDKSCIEYTGEVPDGYESLLEWSINANIRAYKIVDGNLVYDPNRCSILETQFEKEAEDNRYVCHKEISNITNLVKSDTVDSYKRSTTDLLGLLEVTDSNKYASEYIKLVAKENLTGSVTLKFNNGNLLTNDATSKTESGISFVVNADRSITIDGTATADIEFNIGGTYTNTKPMLALKKNTNYYLSSNGHQIKMYNYDGTERTEVYNGTGGVINLSFDSKVTNIVLAIPNGTTTKETIYPMLNLGTTANEYITYQGNETTIYLGDKSFNAYDKIKIESGIPILQNEVYINDDLIIGNFTIGGVFTELDICTMPYTYLDKTYMYAYDDIDLMVTYPNTEKDLDLCGYETPNQGFAVDDEGNMYCNNATIRGSAIVNGGKFSVDAEGNMTCKGAILDSANIVNGDIHLQSSQTTSKIQVTDVENNNCYFQMAARRWLWKGLNGGDLTFWNVLTTPQIGLTSADGSSNTSITATYITTPVLNQTSREESKKNFELFKDALSIIKDIDLYKYNLKSEEDETKKHIGFVIGENYNYSSEITAVDDEGKEIGVDVYSMASLCLQAIKEQQNLIEELKEEIKQLKESE